jgi:60 kDa SS-A/Ro ribonucleoprotein
MRVSSFGSTDCSAPIVWARQNRVDVDTFAVITDNETYAGRVHPHEALRDYRQATGIDARLQVVAVVPTEFSIADPADPRQLDVSGFDSAAPVLLANHSAGRV